MLDGLLVNAQKTGDVGDASVAQFASFDGGVAAAILLAERTEEGLHVLFDIWAKRELHGRITWNNGCRVVG
jgi:hypothetical protein